MAPAHKRRPGKTKDTSFGRGKAKRYILEHMIQNYGQGTPHYDLVSRMRLPPLSIKKVDHIEHHIRELEHELKMIKADYAKTDSGSIKVYELLDDEGSFLKIFREILYSPYKLDIMESSYFKRYINENNLNVWISDWKKNYRDYIKEGLELAISELGRPIHLSDYEPAIIKLIQKIVSDKEKHGMILKIPLLAYMFLNGAEGAKEFWLYLNNVYENIPEIFVYGKELVEFMSDNSGLG